MLDIEILSPVGSPENLNSALFTGADAVYLGLSSFSARRNAQNFTTENLGEAVNRCHILGVKVYITLNTLVFDEEIDEIKNILVFLSSVKVDAIIVQDLAIMSLCKEIAPDIPLHASTQMTINSVSGAKIAKKMGFSRVVLARELSFNDIKHITESCDIETEVFVHGALCVSVSGQCYMSAMLGSRSGNRGLCAQPCRLDYKYTDSNNVLSLKDLSILNEIKELSEIGVTSVKIEGRMKRPEYVAAVTNACYKIKNGAVLSDTELNDIKAIFSRSGFTKGYFDGTLENMSGIREKEDVIAAENVLKKFKELYRKPIRKRKINITIDIQSEKEIICKASIGKTEFTKNFGIPEKSITKSTTRQDVETQLSKLGDTMFMIGEIECFIDNGLYLSLSELNNIKRTVIREAEIQLLRSE